MSYKQPNWIRFILRILACLMVFSTIAGFFNYSIFYYISLFLFASIIILQKSKWQLGEKYIAFLLFICFVSLLVNNPPSYFNSWERLSLFALFLILFSPVVKKHFSIVIRTEYFIYILDICAILSVGSFFAYFFGVNLFMRNEEYLAISAGKFSGLMDHSMKLGPVAAISALYLQSMMYVQKKLTTKRILLIGIVCCVGASLLAASRIAILSGMLAFGTFYYRYYNEKREKLLKIYCSIFIVGAMSFPIWKSWTDFVIEKHVTNIEYGSYMYSREKKMNARINEFWGSPIIGVGYNVIDPSLEYVNKKTGRIEPGSSWLGILSMTGLMGFICFLYIYIKYLKISFHIRNNLISSFYTSLLIYLGCHMFAEGWIYSSRNLLNIIFWLLISSIYFHHNKIIESKLH